MSQIIQMKITLEGIRPPIWRRVLVDKKSTLADLHSIIQETMGWTNSHLHQFIIRGVFFDPNPQDPDCNHDAKDEHKYTLSELHSGEVSEFHYEYDFGDGWNHTIVFEKLLPLDPIEKYPRCIKGKRACPPEDVGGIWGYQSMLDTLRGPQSDEKDGIIEWLGTSSFDSGAFDLESANLNLDTIQPGTSNHKFDSY